MVNKTIPQSKTCAKCLIKKSPIEFTKSVSSKDGLDYWCKSCKSIHFRKHYAKNKKHISKTSLKWRTKNKDRHASNYRQWVAKNLEVKLDHNRNRRAKILNAVGTHTTKEILQLYENQLGKCANPHCLVNLKDAGRSLDHIVSLTNGGSNSVENLQWLCPPCNGSKGTSDLNKWLAKVSGRNVAEALR